MINEEAELLRAFHLLTENGYEVRRAARRPNSPLRLCDVTLPPGAVFKLRRNGEEFIVLDSKDQFGRTHMWNTKRRCTMSSLAPNTEIEIVSQ
jgi:hypothetical protein